MFNVKGFGRYFVLLLLVLCFSCSVAYAVSSPVAVMQSAANKMVQQLEKNKSQLKSSRGRAIINRIVDQVLMPRIEINRMAGMVLGRRYWQQASASQKKRFIAKFKNRVVSTYAAAMKSFDDDVVKFYPLRVNYKAQKAVRVRSIIIRKNGQRIPVSYNMVRSGSSWKAYDFSIEGVSVVQSYRAQFAPILSSRGMAGLLKEL